MATPEIQQLINFLQNNGKSVANGSTKFAVTPQILKELNKILHTIKEDIYVSPLSTANLVSKYSNSNELMFLYDIVKKMSKLKISDTSSSHDFTIDISDFTNLKYLELYKFNVKNVKGIHFLRENLEIVVCNRCLDKIGDFLLSCDPDNSVSSIWSKLQNAVFSRNSLTTIDQSFIYTPWLQYLDISYNNLTDIRPLACLSNLTHLNVSYNHLSAVPEIPMCKLEVLLLNQNYITDIKGLSKMESLRELDLSENSIIEHANLLPLADLSCLVSLNISRNPICYHPMHRSFTCGYLHENVANQYFLLDGTTLSSSEREFIRYTSPSINNPAVCALRNTSSNTVIKRKHSKRTRDAFIAEQSCDQDDNTVNRILTSTPVKAQEQDDDDEKYITMKRKIEEHLNQYGKEYWLLQKNKIPGLLDLPSPIGSPSKPSHIVAEKYFDSRSDPHVTKAIIEDSLKTEEPVAEPNQDDEFENKDADDTLIASLDNTLENDNTESNPQTSSYFSESEESEEESDENDDEDLTSQLLWLVEKVVGDSTQSVFIVLNEHELKEINVITTKVISKWSLDCIERCLKIANDPLTIMLTFEVVRHSDRVRKYQMEYADAQKLMSMVQEELNKRPITSYNQKICRCMKCDALFYHELRRRKQEEDEKYKCPICGSTHILEEDESVLPKNNVDGGSNDNSRNSNNKITQSPSLSSIGSAASLDQNSDINNSNEDSQGTYQESDIEIISNPSQSSIEVLEVHSGRSHDSTLTVLPKFLEKLSSVTANQLLTESSSSGSMTDSICTSYETNPHTTRGPHRISQSTVDEVLPEESSAETSPQQRRSEEKTIPENDKSKRDKNTSNESTKLEITSFPSYTSVLEALKEKCQLTSSPRKQDLDSSDLVSTYEYSYTNFTTVDHRIKYYIWDQLVPNNAEISAFLRVDKLCKCGTSTLPFPALLVLTEKNLYFVKITKEEKDDPENWLQKFDSVNKDKIKLIQPILWKQGFCIEVEDRPAPVPTVKYVCFLYDEKRTNDFLSHVRDLGTVHVSKSEDLIEECDLRIILQIEEYVRNFTMTDLIYIVKNKDTKRFPFVGLVVTNADFIVVKGDADWLLPKSSSKPTIVLKESIGNLMKVMESEDNLVLQFLDEIEQSEESWEIKTVTSESRSKIIEAIRAPWEDLYSVQLEVTYAAN